MLLQEYCQEAVQTVLQAGDLLLWDSRLVHCSQGVDTTVPPEVALPGRETAVLSRLVAYVCMIPKTHVPEASARLRAQWVREGSATCHHPCRGVASGTTAVCDKGQQQQQQQTQQLQHVIWDLV